MRPTGMITMLALTAALGAAPEARRDSIQIRFYPDKELRVYEMEPRRALSSAILHNTAILNGSGGPIALERAEIEISAGGAVVQTHRLAPADLQAAAARADKLQKGGMLEAFAFHFRPDILLGKGVTVSPEPRLAPGSALLIGHRVITLQGPADRLTVRAFGRDGQGAEVTGEGSLPIVAAAAASTIEYHFPLGGIWFIGAGQAMHDHHRWVVPEEFALDIVRLGEGGTTHRGEGTSRTQFHAYGQDVLAAADGVVVSVEGSIVETDDMLRRPDEPADLYEQRIRAAQTEWLAAGYLRAGGNHVVIAHAGGEHSFYGHLITGSVTVRKGEAVKRGQVIGRLGTSGNSTEPHLHFHVTDGPDPLFSAGVPVRFANVELPHASGPRAVQSGDIVRTLEGR